MKPAVVIGTALERFDFYLYASMAALVFGEVFFPKGTPGGATLAAIATFAVGFLARPFGGILFGAMADRIGRRKVLAITFLVMGVPSGLIGLLPTYHQVGIVAPAALVLLRICQGLGAGAEFGSAIAVSFEHADDSRRGRMGSLPALGVNIGLMASSLIVALLTSLDRDFLLSWGWRIPFVASFALVALGFVVRRRMPETPEFIEVAQHRERKPHPLLSLIRGSWRGLTVVMIVTIGYNAVSYVFKTFSLSYLAEFRDVAANVGAFGITLASAVAIVTVPIAGALSDRFGSRRILASGAIGVAALAFPFFTLLNTNRPVAIWIALILATGIVVPLMLAASGAYLAQQFRTEVRASGLGTGREVGGAFAGGLAPLAALAMVTASPSHSTLGVSLMFLAGALLIGLGCLLDQSQAVRTARGRTGTVDSRPEPRADTPAGQLQ